MRGEFIGVWRETYREIWAPLTQEEGVPRDIYSQLYEEISGIITDPSGVEVFQLSLMDSIQVREAFHRALVLSGVSLDIERAEQAFAASATLSLTEANERRRSLEHAISNLIADPFRGADVLTIALSELAEDQGRRAEAKQRVISGIVNNRDRSKEAFEGLESSNISGERNLVGFLEAAFEIADDVGGDTLANSYFNLLSAFIEKYSLRYDLRRPCILCPTLPGVFAKLIQELRDVTNTDSHLEGLRHDFENAFRDLRIDCSDVRIRNSIQKQIILLESLAQSYPGITAETLGAICGQLRTWPHDKILEAIKCVYKFTNSYPGIRHAGTPATALRPIDMRDLVAVSILLTGFTPYLSDRLNSEILYRGT